MVKGGDKYLLRTREKLFRNESFVYETEKVTFYKTVVTKRAPYQTCIFLNTHNGIGLAFCAIIFFSFNIIRKWLKWQTKPNQTKNNLANK